MLPEAGAVGDSLATGRAVIYSDTHPVLAKDVAERSASAPEV